MGAPMIRREVMPPHQARAQCDLMSEVQIRAAISRAIWTSAALVGLANMAACMLETWL